MSEVIQPASFRSTAGPSEHLIALLDQHSAASGVRRLRSWAREALRPRPGERVVDIGSGTGDELQSLGMLVGQSGEAIGVEPNPELRAEAERRADESGSLARFVAGEAYALPFEESTVDVVRCERVWQHLDAPDRAAAEIARVLRPGGRAVVIDTDWATAIVHPGDLEVLQTLQRFWLPRFANPFSGRRLAGQLAAVGLVVDDIGSQALLQPAGAIDGILKTMGEVGAQEGVITEAQRDRLQADLRAGVERGDYHFSVTIFAVLAGKP